MIMVIIIIIALIKNTCSVRHCTNINKKNVDSVTYVPSTILHILLILTHFILNKNL